MSTVEVDWRHGAWFVGLPGEVQTLIRDSVGLDAWLAQHGELGRDALDFGGNIALRQRFVNDIGPLNR